MLEIALREQIEPGDLRFERVQAPTVLCGVQRAKRAHFHPWR